jgi:hypothetical protein
MKYFQQLTLILVGSECLRGLEGGFLFSVVLQAKSVISPKKRLLS